jgi:hypothetical protein
MLSRTLIYFCALSHNQEYVHKHKNRGEKRMPRGDRTGPWGWGPMTGRAAGYCAGYPVPGYMNPIHGYGRGWGRGYGRGGGRGFGRGWRRYPPQYPYAYPPPRQIPPQQYPYTTFAYPPAIPPQSSEQEVEALENYKKELEAERTDLEQEMNEIETKIKEAKAKLEQEKKP